MPAAKPWVCLSLSVPPEGVSRRRLLAEMPAQVRAVLHDNSVEVFIDEESAKVWVRVADSPKAAGLATLKGVEGAAGRATDDEVQQLRAKQRELNPPPPPPPPLAVGEYVMATAGQWNRLVGRVITTGSDGATATVFFQIGDKKKTAELSRGDLRQATEAEVTRQRKDYHWTDERIVPDERGPGDGGEG